MVCAYRRWRTRRPLAAARRSPTAAAQLLPPPSPAPRRAPRQGVIGPGGVQWMTAGRGVIHSEMPVVDEGLLHGFQLWINLPKKDKMCKPRWGVGDGIG